MPYVRFNVNKDWLDEAIMSEPKTIAEYEAFFDWVLANKPGCVPVHVNMEPGTTYYEMSQNLLMGAFDLIDNWYVTADDDHKVSYWATGDNYKEYLEMMHRWYERGYLSRDFLSITMTEAQAMFDTGKLACISDSVDAIKHEWIFHRVTLDNKNPAYGRACCNTLRRAGILCFFRNKVTLRKGRISIAVSNQHAFFFDKAKNSASEETPNIGYSSHIGNLNNHLLIFLVKDSSLLDF